MSRIERMRESAEIDLRLTKAPASTVAVRVAIIDGEF